MSLFGKKPEPKPAPVPRVAVQPSRPAPAQPRFGIDDAIRLLGTLPVDDNASLVVLVIKNTLASLKVDVAEVIADGAQKQDRLSSHIAELRAKVAELERQADIHRAEIATVELDLAETTSAKQRLERAERGEHPSGPAFPPPPPRRRSVRPPSFPKPPPRTPTTDPPVPDSSAAPAARDSEEAPKSDPFAMLPDRPPR